MPKTARLTLSEVRPESRTTGRTVEQMMELEARRIESVLPADSERVALDERGREFSTREMANWLDRQIEELAPADSL